MADSEFTNELNYQTERIMLEHKLRTGHEALERIGDELDGRINFRLNSVLKEEFTKVCKKNHSTLSREIKRFMSESVQFQKLV